MADAAVGDQHRTVELVRSGLRMLCATTDDIEVVGEAGSGAEAIRQVDGSYLGKDSPPDQLLDAIYRTASGESPFSHDVLVKLAILARGVAAGLGAGARLHRPGRSST